MHVNPSESCPTCAQKLVDCHNSLKIWFEIISDNFKDCHVSIGYRDEADQIEALAKGLSHAPYPQSKHNFSDNGKPCSWAIDIFRLGEDGKAYFEVSYMENVWALVKKIQDQAGDQEITWGGLFKTLADYDHLELVKVEVLQSIEVLSKDVC